jgi:hypothetical protein
VHRIGAIGKRGSVAALVIVGAAIAVVTNVAAEAKTTHRSTAHASRARAATAAAPMALSAVDSLALRGGAYNGDAGPAEIDSILTTRGAADGAIWPGAGTPPDPGQSVYAVTMRGSFNNSQWTPPGVAPQNYNVLTLVVDAATGQLVDANLRNSSAGLDTIGALTQLPSLNQGVVTGAVVLRGAGAAESTSRGRQSRTQVAAVARGRVVAHRRVHAGTFRFVLRDGTYSLRAGHGCATATVRVSHGQARTVHLSCS